MAQLVGRKISLSLPLRLMGDLAFFAGKIPAALVRRRMELAAVATGRQAASPRPGWLAIFTKAYAIVSARRPELRRAYVGFPWPHLYEHPINVASVAVEGQVRNENGVCFLPIQSPENQSLAEIDAGLRRCREAGISSFASFRWLLRRSRWPRPLRRLLWRLDLNTSGRRRVRSLGTFSIGAVAGLGAASLGLRSPLTTSLSYGVIAPDGALDVDITYDQRALDGGTIARILGELDEVLRHEIVRELGYLRGLEAA